MAKLLKSKEQNKRPDWDTYFLNVAEVVSTRSTCFRNKVGAVIVKDKKIISTGYNGAPKYQKNCQEMGYCYRNRHKIKSGTSLEKCRAVGSHAESNAICLAAKDGSACEGGIIYVFGHVDICPQCRAMIANAGLLKALIRRPSGKLLKYDVKNWTLHSIDQLTPEKEK
ncbi:MAG: cytidine deaminase [Candidatus Lokiarchaeota archaeon]|nr:cytidine deaminase [Candidatus Lokiarchaeota archaeon]